MSDTKSPFAAVSTDNLHAAVMDAVALMGKVILTDEPLLRASHVLRSALVQYADSQLAAPVAPATVAVADGYYLACFRHSSPGKALWWGPNWAGYTPYLEQAGVYTEEELRGRGYFEEREDVPVPASFARGLAVSLIDTGHAKARPFHNATDLRAALAASQREGGGT